MTVKKNTLLILILLLSFLSNAQNSIRAEKAKNTGKFDLAIHYYAMDTLNSPEYLANIAECYALMEKYDSAFYCLEKLIQTDSTYSIAILITPFLFLLHEDERWIELEKRAKKIAYRNLTEQDKKITDELIDIHTDDQKYRSLLSIYESLYGKESPQYDSITQLVQKTDSSNLIRFRSLFRQYGWLDDKKTLCLGGVVAFLVIQHSDIDTQKEFLPIMKEAVDNNMSDKQALEMLIDRMLVTIEGKQLYGTQYSYETGDLFPIETDEKEIERLLGILGLKKTSKPKNLEKSSLHKAENIEDVSNLVVNSGFEKCAHDSCDCPHGTHELESWRCSKGSMGTMGGIDLNYQNSCLDKTFNQKVVAHSGKACVGNVGNSAFFQVELKDSLQKGVSYTVSYYLYIESKYREPLSDLLRSEFGVYFSKEKVNQKYSKPEKFIRVPIRCTYPQVILTRETSNLVSDKWFMVTQKYCADGGERYLVIGNHKPEDEKNKYQYYLDDVSVTMEECGVNRISSLNVGESIQLNNIYFTINKAELLPESYNELDKLVSIMKVQNSMAIEVSGHTDNTGFEEENIKLSNERAKSVVNYLLSKGIKQNSLKYKGYGSAVPVKENTTDSNKAKNRRVEIKILTK